MLVCGIGFRVRLLVSIGRTFMFITAVRAINLPITANGFRIASIVTEELIAITIIGGYYIGYCLLLDHFVYFVI